MKIYATPSNRPGEVTLMTSRKNWMRLKAHFGAQRSAKIGTMIDQAMSVGNTSTVRLTTDRAIAEVIVREASLLVD